MKKRILSLFLALSMVSGMFLMFPATSFAATSGKCGDNLTWTLDDEGTLTISGTGEMYNYAFCDREDITNVIIENGLTDIGNGAFSYCRSLTSIIIPNGVTSISHSSFADCTNLTDIIIPGSVTIIKEAAFRSCYSLKEITIPGGVYEIGRHAFSNCKSLINIRMSDNITIIGEGAFQNCTSLTNINIPKGVKYIHNRIFYRCINLKSIEFVNTLQSIGGEWVFKDSSLSDIYYLGTEKQWSNIEISANACIPSNVKIHYGSGNSFTPVNTNPSKPDDGNSEYTYGVVRPTTAEKADVRKQLKIAAEQFNEAALEYTSAVSKSALTQAGTLDDVKELADKLEKEFDDNGNGKRILFSSTPDSEAKKAAFMGYAKFLNQMVEEGISLNKIDLSENSVMIDYKLTREILSKVRGKKQSYDYNGYRINIDAFSMMSAYTGTLDVISPNGQKIKAMITSTVDDTAKDLQTLANQLKSVAEDVNKQALRTVATDLVNLSGLGDLGKLIARDGLKSYKPLTKLGYGNVVKNVKKCYSGYEAVKAILNCADIDTLDSIIENPQKLVKKIEDVCGYEAALENAVVNAAQNKLENAIYNLFLKACDYQDMREGNEPEFADKVKDFFGKFSSWVSAHFQCPVDFTVYNEAGEMIGYVDDGDIYYNDDIYIETSGDVKKLYVPVGMNVDIQMMGTDMGEFNYVVEEVIYNQPTGRLNYYGLPLSEEASYRQSLDTTEFANNTQALPVLCNSENIFADEYISSEDTTAYVIVDADADNAGTVLGEGEYAKGDSVELTAIPSDERYIFNGWYIDDELVSTDSVFRFSAVENTSVYAKFMREYFPYEAYDMQISEQSGDFYSYIYKDYDDKKGIVIVPFTDEAEDSMQIYVSTYATDDTVINDNICYSATMNENGIYAFENVDLENAARIVVKDKNGIEIASAVYNSIKPVTVSEQFSDRLDAEIHNEAGNTSIVFEFLGETEININAYQAKYEENGRFLNCIFPEGIKNGNKIKFNVSLGKEEKLMFWNINMSPLTEIITSEMLGL